MEKFVQAVFLCIKPKNHPQRTVVKFGTNVEGSAGLFFSVERVEACGVEVDELWTNLLNRHFLTFNFQKSVDCGKTETVELQDFPQRLVRDFLLYFEMFSAESIPLTFPHYVENTVETLMLFTFQPNRSNIFNCGKMSVFPDQVLLLSLIFLMISSTRVRRVESLAIASVTLVTEYTMVE